MKTVHEVSQLTGVSIRALQHYDNIGLLHPAARSKSGYRLYSQDDLARLQQILLFRELEFSLKDIRRMLESPDFDRNRALRQQIDLLRLKRQRIDGLIELAENLLKGSEAMEFSAFDTSKMDEYAQQAKASWGHTPEWRDFEQKSAGRSPAREKELGAQLMELFKPFGQMAAAEAASAAGTASADPACEAAQAQARAIQEFISEHYYACSDEVFAQLGRAYGSGGDFTRNINAAAGEGAAEFAARAIEVLVNKAGRES